MARLFTILAVCCAAVVWHALEYNVLFHVFGQLVRLRVLLSVLLCWPPFSLLLFVLLFCRRIFEKKGSLPLPAPSVDYDGDNSYTMTEYRIYI